MTRLSLWIAAENRKNDRGKIGRRGEVRKGREIKNQGIALPLHVSNSEKNAALEDVYNKNFVLSKKKISTKSRRMEGEKEGWSCILTLMIRAC